jgi:hypothetical protein
MISKRYGFTFGLISLAVLSCSQRPIEQLSLADVAIKAAQKARADSFASETYRRAENYYLRAKKDYNEGYFDSAKKNADEARRLAEQSEYQAIYKQNKAKDKIISPTGGGDGSAPVVTPIPETPPQ